MGASDDYHPGPLRASRVWESSTPYIATRYAKTRGQDRIDLSSPEACARFLRDDLVAQCADVRPDLSGEGTSVVTIEPLWDENHVFKIAGKWRPIQFQRFRRKAGDDGGRRLAGAFRLIFRNPVSGPIALGHSSHFGLGQFGPVDGP
jgi:CRISPR-associated protein Csb2